MMTRDWPRNNGFSYRKSWREKAGRGRGEPRMEKSKAQSVYHRWDGYPNGWMYPVPLSYHTDLLRFWSLFYWLFVFFFMHHARWNERLLSRLDLAYLCLTPLLWFLMSKSISILIVPNKEGTGSWRGLKLFPTFSLDLVLSLNQGGYSIKSLPLGNRPIISEEKPCCWCRFLL